MIVWADVFVMSVFHAKSAGDGAQLFETESFVEVSCVDVGGDDGVELHDAEVMGGALFQTVTDEFFTDMKPTAVTVDSVAGVADMSASSYIIRMKNVLIRFDIIFYVRMKDGLSQIIINIEAQKMNRMNMIY